jgi:O-acetylhomoserine/O-acetylserine sulfhydrylase-like pyridoxal-dependent enzyme
LADTNCLSLVRLSIGIENESDLRVDLEGALSGI